MCKRSALGLCCISLFLAAGVEGQTSLVQRRIDSLNGIALDRQQLDSLRSLFDRQDPGSTEYVKNAYLISKNLFETEDAWLTTRYANDGLKASLEDSDTANIHWKIALHKVLGRWYIRQGKNLDAADQYNQIRLLDQICPSNANKASAFNGLALVHYQLGQYSKSLDYYRTALTYLAPGDVVPVSSVYQNMGNCYNDLARRDTAVNPVMLDSAIRAFQKAIPGFLAVESSSNLSVIYQNMAFAYHTKGDNGSFEKNIGLALEQALRSGNPYLIGGVYQRQGEHYLASDPARSKALLLKAVEYLQKVRINESYLASLSLLADACRLTGDYRESAGLLATLSKCRDTLLRDESTTRLLRMEEDYQSLTAAREQELHLLRDQAKQRTMLIILGASLGLLVILLVMGIQVYRLRMNINRTKDKFYSLIAHDLRSPFSGLIGLSGLLAENTRETGDQQLSKQIGTLHSTINHVYQLMENLLQWSKAETGRFAFNPQRQFLANAVDRVLPLLEETARQKNLRLVSEVDPAIEARYDSNMIMTVIRNLVSNAIKFSPDGGSIRISAGRQHHSVEVAVRDEGVGMNAEQISRLFQAQNRLSTLGTRNETGTGLGLILCRNFIARHGGKIRVESEPGKGTTIRFTLPD